MSDIKEIITQNETKKPENADILQIRALITECMRPVMESIGTMLKNNTEALEQLAGAQSIQNSRIEALEKQIRLQTPITSKQATFLNEAIRKRSREILDKRDIQNQKAITKLGGQVRKSLLSRYGISNVREIPKHEYNIAMEQIALWNDVLVVRDIVNEFREEQ